MTDTEELMNFLEETLPQIVTPKTQALYAVAIEDDGNPKTVYYHCSPLDRWTILGSIVYDAMEAFLKDNPNLIKEILEGEEDEDNT